MKLQQLIVLFCLMLSSYSFCFAEIGMGLRKGIYFPDPAISDVINGSNYEGYVNFPIKSLKIEVTAGENVINNYADESVIQSYRCRIEETYKTQVLTVSGNIKEYPKEWKNAYYSCGLGLILSKAELQRRYFENNKIITTTDGFGAIWPYEGKKKILGIGFCGGIGKKLGKGFDVGLFFRYAWCPVKDNNWRFYKDVSYDLKKRSVVVSSLGKIKNTEGSIFYIKFRI